MASHPDNLFMISRWEAKAREALPSLLQDNSHLSAEELADLADKLSPGGVHTGASLLLWILDEEIGVDPLLVAAIIRANWKGGARGFQFLPDTAEMRTPEDYEWLAETLINRLGSPCAGDPLRLLTASDRALYLSLPERFTVYRGCGGVSEEMARHGVCWTLTRSSAEYFATRARLEPVLLSANIRKSQVATVFDSEGGEIVVKPKTVEVLKWSSP